MEGKDVDVRKKTKSPKKIIRRWKKKDVEVRKKINLLRKLLCIVVIIRKTKNKIRKNKKIKLYCFKKKKLYYFR